MRTDRELEQALEHLAGLVTPPGSVVDRVMQRLETETLPTQTLPPARLAPDVPTDEADGVSRESRLKEQLSVGRHARWRLIAMFQYRSVRWSFAAAVAAIIILTVGLWPGRDGRGKGNGVAWATVVKTMEAATNIHTVQTMIRGKETQGIEAWVRKPAGYRIDTPEQSVIDDGKSRLTIDKKARTAQWADSPFPYGSTETDWISSVADGFRQGFGGDVRMTKVAAECTDSQLVYLLSDKESKASAKVWVRANSLLLERLEGTDVSGATMRFTVSYEPIPDSVFAMSVPAGFKELPRPERRKVSGRVIDASNAPVAGAIVCLTDAWGQFARETNANDRGEFAMTLPPKGAPHDRLNFPVFLRAFRPDDPACVAWTLLRSPDDQDELAGTIPGDPGKLEIARQGQASLASATGVVLKMEPATYLAGQVTDLAGKPIAGASVRVEAGLFDKWGSLGPYVRLGGPAEDGQAVALTDEQGRYRFTHLPVLWKPSVLSLRSSAPGYASRDRRLEIGKKWSRDSVDFQLFEANWTVSGRVVDDRGVALAKRMVSALVNGESIPSCFTQTDGTGVFRLDHCPATSGLQIKAELSREPGSVSPQERVIEPWYYLDVVRNVQPVPNRTQYEVTLTAQVPNITLEVVVKNSAGEAVPYFPVEVSGNGIPPGWAWSRFRVRTDNHGRCTIRNVPRADKLRIRLDAVTQFSGEQLRDEVRRIADGYKDRYALIDIPVSLTPDKLTYTIDATALSQEEYRSRKR